MGLGFQPTEYVDVSATIETKDGDARGPRSQLTWLGDHDGVDIVEQMRTATPLPRPPMRRRVRGGVRSLPDTPQRDDAAPAAVKGRSSGHRDRVRLRHGAVHQLPRPVGVRARQEHPPERAGGSIRTPSSGSGIVDARGAVLPGIRRRHRGRIRAARDDGRQFVAIVPVGPMPQYELAARMINEERHSLRARAHVQHGRVRERGRRHRSCLVAGVISARDARTLLRLSSTPTCARPRSQVNFPTTDALADYFEPAGGSGGADSVTAGWAVLAHRFLGVPPRPRVRRRPRRLQAGRRPPACL